MTNQPMSFIDKGVLQSSLGRDGGAVGTEFGGKETFTVSVLICKNPPSQAKWSQCVKLTPVCVKVRNSAV